MSYQLGPCPAGQSTVEVLRGSAGYLPTSADAVGGGGSFDLTGCCLRSGSTAGFPQIYDLERETRGSNHL